MEQKNTDIRVPLISKIAYCAGSRVRQSGLSGKPAAESGGFSCDQTLLYHGSRFAVDCNGRGSVFLPA
jgi:hypothetical protein